MKWRQTFHVQADPAKIQLLAAQLAHDSIDHQLDLWRR
jgi:hypothetical protein